MANVAPVTDLDIPVEEMKRHVARFKEQKSTAKAFIETRYSGPRARHLQHHRHRGARGPGRAPGDPAQDFDLAIVRCERVRRGAALRLTQECSCR